FLRVRRLTYGRWAAGSTAPAHRLRRTISALRAEAKPTQPRYGAIINAAGRSTRALAAVYAPIAGSSSPRSRSAAAGRRAPKNSGVHAAFSASCTSQSPSARFRCGDAGRCATRHADIAISAYSAVHTIGKTAPGGVKPGFSSRRYQRMVWGRPRVSALPINAVTSTAVDTPASAFAAPIPLDSCAVIRPSSRLELALAQRHSGQAAYRRA